jgi:hypothetical protein
MKAIRIVLDKKPSQATGRTEQERDREGYATQPQRHDESQAWEAEAVWPKDSLAGTRSIARPS